MDNREAMIKGLLSPHFLNDSHHYITKEYPRKEVFKHGLSKGFDIGWQAATAHNTDAVIDLLEKVEAALKLSQSICDAVPTMAHHSEDSAMSALGRLVNLQEDGTHGYSTIRETESAVSEFLNSLRSLKTNKEG